MVPVYGTVKFGLMLVYVYVFCFPLSWLGYVYYPGTSMHIWDMGNLQQVTVTTRRPNGHRGPSVLQQTQTAHKHRIHTKIKADGGTWFIIDGALGTGLLLGRPWHMAPFFQSHQHLRFHSSTGFLVRLPVLHLTLPATVQHRAAL